MKTELFKIKICMCPLLILCAIGCVTPSPVNETKQSIPEHYEIWTSKEYKAGIGPVNITDKFVIGDGNKVYVIAKFMDLVANSKYKFKFEWYSPNGKMYGSKSVIQKVSGSNWLTGNYLKLDRKYQESYTPGLWSVKVYANDMYIDENKFFIAHDSSELKKIVGLEEKRESKKIEKPKLTQTVSDYWAVAIGISEYKYSGQNGLENLIFADDDAKAFVSLLYDLGWSKSHIKLLVNEEATKKGIEAELKALSKCSADDVVVISFSGHGSENHELVTYDYNSRDIEHTAISLETLKQWFEQIPAQTLVLILDCCFSGGMGAKVLKVDIKPRMAKSTATLIDQLSGNGRIILTASGPDEPAWESQKTGHGLLTHFLIEALQGVEEVQSAGKISIYKLLEYVSKRVRTCLESSKAKS